MRALATVLLLISALASQGATWRVEKDGSGDFTVIQDAIDAAAAGDTVSIGSGTWQDLHATQPAGPHMCWAERHVMDYLALGVGLT